MTRKHRWIRRSLAAALIVVGALLMLLTPPVRAGLAALLLGVALELAGLAMDRRDN